MEQACANRRGALTRVTAMSGGVRDAKAVGAAAVFATATVAPSVWDQGGGTEPKICPNIRLDT